MIQFNAPHFQPPAPPSVFLGPLAPAEYLRLRRAAAGLTVAQLAARLSERGGFPFNTVRDMIEQVESRGTVARHAGTIMAIASVVPLDVNVYRQLAHAPAPRHPSICRGCGCSAHDHCLDAQGDECCTLLTQHICSRCAGDLA